MPGHCNGGSIRGPIGMNGELIGPGHIQDTMRMNGAAATYIGGSIVELAPGQSVKGSVGTTPSGSSSSQISTSFNANSISENDNANEAEVPHAIGNQAIFNIE
jgi:hypothetical protein